MWLALAACSGETNEPAENVATRTEDLERCASVTVEAAQDYVAPHESRFLEASHEFSVPRFLTLPAHLAITAGTPGTHVSTLTYYDGEQPVRCTYRAPSGDPPEPNPNTSSTVYQAEAGELRQTIVEANHTGYRGEGFTNYIGATDASVGWTVNAAEAGTHTLSIRYALGSEVRRFVALVVDDVEIIDQLEFARTGSWSFWRNLTVPVELAAGEHHIELVTTGGDGPNLDEIAVYPPGHQPPVPPPPPEGSLGFESCESGLIPGDVFATQRVQLRVQGEATADAPHVAGRLVFEEADQCNRFPLERCAAWPTLVARRSPTSGRNGIVRLPIAHEFVIPRSIAVTSAGGAPTGTRASLLFRRGTTGITSCLYQSGANGAATLDFLSCSRRFQLGDRVTADYLSLSVVKDTFGEGEVVVSLELRSPAECVVVETSAQDDDHDGIPTEVELNDSRTATIADVDGDGLPNWLDPDSDGDGVPDGDEPRGDADADGVPDYLDSVPECRTGTATATRQGSGTEVVTTPGTVTFSEPIQVTVPEAIAVASAEGAPAGSTAEVTFSLAGTLVERCQYQVPVETAAATSYPFVACELTGAEPYQGISADQVELTLTSGDAPSTGPLTAQLSVHEYGQCRFDGCLARFWYADRDGDGFGDPNVPIAACQAPVGFAVSQADCNDDPQGHGPITFPGAKEPCNYDDFNCDGQVATCAPPPPHEPLPPQEDAFVVSSFAAGHPFVASSGGQHDLNDPSDVYPGLSTTQSAFIRSDGSNGNAKTLRAVNLPAFDFSDAMPKLWLKVTNVNHARDLSLYLGNGGFRNYVRFNFRSSQGQKWITEGDWVAFTMGWNEQHFSQVQLQPGVTLADLRRNVTDVQLRIVDDGTPVTLRINRVSAVREPRAKYPSGVISITFDDNTRSQYLHAKPKLDQYGFAATAYTIVGFLDTPGYMTTDQLKDLQLNSGWEVGFHAFDPVMHIQSYAVFPAAQVERDILAGRQWLWENGFTAEPRKGLANFAYPKGEFRGSGPTDVLELARRHFTSARTINERHQESLLPSDPHKLRVIYITAPETTEQIIQQIERSIAAGEWIILGLHSLVAQPVDNDQWEIEKFNQLIDYLGTRQPAVPVRTVGDVLSDLDGLTAAPPASP